jgi:hypothetical protein
MPSEGRVEGVRRPLDLSVAFLLLLCCAVPRPLRGQENGEPTAANQHYQELSSRLQTVEDALAGALLDGEGSVPVSAIATFPELQQQINLALYGDLMDRSRVLALLIAEREPARMERALEGGPNGKLLSAGTRKLRLEPSLPFLRGAFWISLGAGAGSFGLSYAFWYLGAKQDEAYFGATTVEEAVSYRSRFQLLSLASLVAAGVAAVSAGLSAALLAATPELP